MYYGSVTYGTWTPDFTFGGSSTGITFNYNYGWYQKIGKQVDIFIVFSILSTGISVGQVQITNAPFPFAGNGYSSGRALGYGMAGVPSGDTILILGTGGFSQIGLFSGDSSDDWTHLGSLNLVTSCVVSANLSYTTT